MCGFVFVRVRGVCRKVRSRSDRQSCFGPSGPATSRRPRRRAVPYGRRPIRSAAGLSLATGIDLDRGRRAAASGGEGPQFVSEPARPSQAAPRACRLQACLATKSTSVEVVRAAASRRRKPAVRIRTCAPFAGCAPSVSAGGLFCNWNRPCKRSAARSRPLAEGCISRPAGPLVRAYRSAAGRHCIRKEDCRHVPAGPLRACPPQAASREYKSVAT